MPRHIGPAGPDIAPASSAGGAGHRRAVERIRPAPVRLVLARPAPVRPAHMQVDRRMAGHRRVAAVDKVPLAAAGAVVVADRRAIVAARGPETTCPPRGRRRRLWRGRLLRQTPTEPCVICAGGRRLRRMLLRWVSLRRGLRIPLRGRNMSLLWRDFHPEHGAVGCTSDGRLPGWRRVRWLLRSMPRRRHWGILRRRRRWVILRRRRRGPPRLRGRLLSGRRV